MRRIDVSVMKSCHVGYLPIVLEYAKRMELVETINALLDCKMRIPPGKVVLTMIMDILCGRTPLYRIHESFANRDLEGLLGKDVVTTMLTDDTIGRTLDRLYSCGTQKIFSHVCINTYQNFFIDCSTAHHDTTSVSVHGMYIPQEDDPITITYGHSKDHRPDLKQFIFSLLCVEGNIPLALSTHDGNASDKTINATVLSRISRIMREHGLKDKEFIFVTDSAMVTENNLKNVGNTVLFISRLPETYKECLHVKSEAIREGKWHDIGPLIDVPKGSKYQPAFYRVAEKAVELYGTNYRAVVVHSDSHDKRRRKKIKKAIQHDKKDLENRSKNIAQREFFCLRDAQKTIEDIRDGKYHTLIPTIIEKPVFSRGRTPKDGTRKIKEMRYLIHIQIECNTDAIATLEEEAGCFVLLTNIPQERTSSHEILKIYKEQNFIEQNFAFLKDPLVGNDLFLKLPHRIEALGLVFVISLLLWRLMERTMRKNVYMKKCLLKGWNNRLTDRPTSYMMFSKFSSVQVLIIKEKRYLVEQFNPVQWAFLEALDVSPSIFTDTVRI